MTTDRISLLTYEADALEQDLLDIDPSTDEFWETTAQLEAIQATLRLLLAARKDA